MRFAGILLATFALGGGAVLNAVADDPAPAKPAQLQKKAEPPAKGAPDDLDDLKPLPRPGQDKTPKGDTIKKPAAPKDDGADDPELKKLIEEGRRIEKDLQMEADQRKAGPPSQEDPKEILARIAKNLEAAEDRLKNQDPGKQTSKIQGDIVKDLDELLKQQQKKQQQQQQASSKSSSGGGGGGGAQSSTGGQSGQGGQGGQGGQAGTQTTQKGSSKGGQTAKGQNGGQTSKDKKGQGGTQTAKNQGGASKDKKGTSGSAAKKGQDQSAKGGKGGAGGSGGGGIKREPPKTTNLADVLRTEQDIWGHLPQAKRLEMDVYQRDRIPPQYEELLRQYYRSIAERHRRKGE
jgi:hypothetical protein